ncbi:CHASE2 domain-containing protein [Oleiharenicola lentus]|uniref:CHASE2 domain-containing protein n=1 Tax=Oleiharenicola lentus TaxID=2508720 RepID=UPI003F670C80
MTGQSSRTTFKQIWWLPLVCFGFAWVLSHTETVERSEWKSLDWRTDFRTNFQQAPDPRVAVVLFDDQTEAVLGQPWPVDRQYHAQLTQVFALAGAKMVAWDVILDASREGAGDGAMGQVAQAADEAGTVVVSAAVTSVDPTDMDPTVRSGPTKPFKDIEGNIANVVGDDHVFLPFPELREASLYGFADTPPGVDGIRREVPMVVRVGKEIYPALSLQIALSYYGVDPQAVRVRLGDGLYFQAEGKTRRVPIDALGRLALNYRYDMLGGRETFPIYNYGSMLVSLSEVFLENKTLENPPPDLKSKIVIVGQTVTGKADIGPSPLSRSSALTLVIANAVNNLLIEDYVRQLSAGTRWILWALLIAVGYAVILLVAHRVVFVLCGGAVLSVVGYSSLALWMWVWHSWWLPWIAPVLGLIFLQFAVIGRRIWIEQKAKQAIKGMFGAYVSPEVVDQLVKSETPPQLGGHIENITAYFSDIQGFSTFAEQLPPDKLVELMNEYLTACTDIIQQEGGTLDKYIGDAVVAMFGAPVPLPDHARRACVAAQRVQEKIAELRAKWRSEGDKWPPIVWEMETRIGLNSGACVVGNMGSRTRFNYTMMGDDVNLAARMESGAKSWGARTMCTEVTKSACENLGGDRVVFRPLGRVIVKGREQAVPIYEIVGLRDSITARKRECCAVFAAGLERYFARDWTGAMEHFRRSAELEDEGAPMIASGVFRETPSDVYISIVEDYMVDPPSMDWDGVYVMKSK